MFTMLTTGRPGRILAAISGLLLAAGLAVGLAGPAAAAPTTGTRAASLSASAPQARAADTWEFHGFFPDPVTCAAAGIASGYPFTCNFVFVGFTLWLRVA